MGNVQIYITPLGFSICKECLKLAAVTKSQRRLILDIDVITDFIFTSSRVFLNGSLWHTVCGRGCRHRELWKKSEGSHNKRWYSLCLTFCTFIVNLQFSHVTCWRSKLPKEKGMSQYFVWRQTHIFGVALKYSMPNISVVHDILRVLYLKKDTNFRRRLSLACHILLKF